MNKLIKAAGLSAALAALVAMPAQAQTGSGSIGLFGGYQLGGHLAEDEDDGPDSDLDYDNEWLGGLSLEFWLGDTRRVGLRFDGSYTEGGWDESNSSIPEDTDVNLWMGDANLMYRFSEPDFDTRFLPFLSFGVGAMHWNRADDLDLGFLPADAAIPEKATKLALTPSVGADIFLSDAVSLRLEAKDYWNLSSPYEHLGTDDNHDGGHNIQLRAGLNFFWGVLSPPPPPRPEPEPEPRPEPEPEPEPETETITRCVVNQNGEIETVTATRYVDTGRVVVTRNGVEVDFEDAYPARTPVYVRNADWYVRDQPVTVRLQDDVDDTRLTGDATGELTRLEFVRFGSPTTMNASDLVYVGSIDGTPVFARQADVRNIMPRLNTALRTRSDLEAILRDDQELARDFSQLRTLYMAVEPDCVFQPISLTTYVRSTRG